MRYMNEVIYVYSFEIFVYAINLESDAQFMPL